MSKHISFCKIKNCNFSLIILVSCFLIFEKSSQAKNRFAFSQKELEQLEIAKKNTNEAQKQSQAMAEYHFSMGQAYSLDGDMDHAIEEYRLTLAFDPYSPLIHTRLAAEYIKKGLMSLAMESCKEAVKLNPQYNDARLILAGLYATTQQADAAITQYNFILKNDPHHEEAIIYKSQTLVDEGKNSLAIQILKEFIKKNQSSALAYYYLARSEHQANHLKDAKVFYEKAIRLKANFSQAAIALGHIFEEENNYSKALKVYQDAYSESQDLGAASRIATIYIKEEKYKEAIPYLKVIEASDPEDMNVRVKLGLIQMELKNYSESIVLFRKLLEKNPDSDRIHYYLGSLYEETLQIKPAIDEFMKIQPDSKLYSDAALHSAFLLKKNNQYDEAKKVLDKAIQESPKNPNFYIFQASMEEEIKKVQSASEILETAVKEFPNDEKIRYYLGSLYDRLGLLDKSLEQMEFILTFNPENVDALNYIGYTWTIRGMRLNDAEKMLKKAMNLRPGNGYIQDSWGLYLLTRGRTSEAIQELEKAARLKPKEPTILEHLGDAYAKYNLREKALNQYQEAILYLEDNTAKDKVKVKAEQIKKELTRVPASQ